MSNTARMQPRSTPDDLSHLHAKKASLTGLGCKSRRRASVLAAALVMIVSALPLTGGTIADDLSQDIEAVISDPGNTTLGSRGVYFEQNIGQFHPDVMFKVHGTGTTMFLTASGAVYLFAEEPTPLDLDDPLAEPVAETLDRHAVFVNHTGALPVVPVGLQPLAGKSNYFIGNVSTEWITNVPHFAQVVYPEVYPGISMAWYFAEGRLKYDFIVAPGGDPGDIELSVDGASSVSVDADGRLVLATSLGDLEQDIPYTYQDTGEDRVRIGARYVVAGSAVTFEIGDYDPLLPLVIDPLVYSTWLPPAVLSAVDIDSRGNAYLAGRTNSPDFPATSGAYQEGMEGQWDAVVMKLDSAGSGLVYATYVGGSDYAHGGGPEYGMGTRCGCG